MDAFAKTRLDAIFNGKKTPPPDLVETFDYTVTVKKDEGLGLELKNLMIVNITYSSPCTGQIKVGDVLLSLNGMQVTAQDKMAKLIQTIFNGQLTAKMIIKVMRFKRHISRPSTFPPLAKHEGFTTDTLVLYNLKGYFHLGLDIKELEGKLIVCDFVDNSLADITFSLGEAILDVDGEKITTCASFNDRVRKSLEIRNFCLITVEIPSTDPLKNLLRNQITKATKEVSKSNKLPPDAASYATEGITVFKANSNNPLKSIWLGEKHNKTSESANRLKMDDKVKEMDVPTGWNSRLFVRLPPMKTVESEALPQ